MKSWEAIYLPWCLLAFVLVIPVAGPVLAVNFLLVGIEQYYFHRKRMKTVDYIIEHELPKDFPYKEKKHRKAILFWINFWVFEKFKRRSIDYRLEMLQKYEYDLIEKYPILTHNQVMGTTVEYAGLKHFI